MPENQNPTPNQGGQASGGGGSVWMQDQPAQGSASQQSRTTSTVGGGPFAGRTPGNQNPGNALTAFGQIPELSSAVKQAMDLQLACAAAGIDWTKIINLAKPQLLAILSALLQQLLAGGGSSGGGSGSVPPG